jgi:AcrR family transcriptional regulator
MDVAAGLFAENGYNGTNLQDVADALGISRPGLYYHFSSKEKLLHAMAEELTLPSLQVANEVQLRSPGEPAEALRELMSRNCRWLLTHGQLFRVLDRSEAYLPPELSKRHSESKRAMLDSLVAVIEHGIEIGQFRPVDATVSAFAMIGMCNWTVWWFKPDGRLQLEAIVEIIADAAVRIVLRSDSHRSRSGQVKDILRILKEDVSHLERMIEG